MRRSIDLQHLPPPGSRRERHVLIPGVQTQHLDSLSATHTHTHRRGGRSLFLETPLKIHRELRMRGWGGHCPISQSEWEGRTWKKFEIVQLTVKKKRKANIRNWEQVKSRQFDAFLKIAGLLMNFISLLTCPLPLGFYAVTVMWLYCGSSKKEKKKSP